MINNTFKKSSITEMCKQIKSAPVIFRLKDGTDCLSFYNNENCIEASKLYILFPDTSCPKYIEGNDLYNLRECIIHSVNKQKAIALYNKINKSHKRSTVDFINSLIDKTINVDTFIPEKVNVLKHMEYNKKHACAWVNYNNKDIIVFAKDLKDKQALEVIIDSVIKYNITFDCVYWAAGISAKEFTNLKVSIEKHNA